MRYPRTLCQIQVTNPGGGSGSGTVQTDGVTLQGDGSGGNPLAIKAVQTDASLTGAGTVASTLKQVYSSSFAWGNGLANVSITANQVQVWGIWLPFPITVSTLWLGANNVDTTHHFDAGLYNPAGTLVLHTGAVLWGNAILQSMPISGAPISLEPGPYLIAVTGEASATNQFSADNSTTPVKWFVNTNYTSSSGGALPGTITAPTLAMVRGQNMLTLGLS